MSVLMLETKKGIVVTESLCVCVPPGPQPELKKKTSTTDCAYTKKSYNSTYLEFWDKQPGTADRAGRWGVKLVPRGGLSGMVKLLSIETVVLRRWCGFVRCAGLYIVPHTHTHTVHAAAQAPEPPVG